MNKICYKQFDNLDFFGFLLFADEIRTFDGKIYRVKGVRCQRVDRKRSNDKDDLKHLYEIMYYAKTIKSDKNGLIAFRKKKYQPIKCSKNLSLSSA